MHFNIFLVFNSLSIVPHLLLIHGACSIKHFNKIYDQMAENDNFFLIYVDNYGRFLALFKNS